jgi:hypothetical protein
MYCKSCGKSIDKDSAFCKYCGNPQQKNRIDTAPADKKIETVIAVCNLLLVGDERRASEVARKGYPFEAVVRSGSTDFSPKFKMKIYKRDGFIDRISGAKVLLPGAMQILSTVLPQDFPEHRKAKIGIAHFIWHEFFPTVEHLKPRAMGGTDDLDNLFTATSRTNSAKSIWTLQELGCTLQPKGNITEWDGMSQWFLNYVGKHEAILNHPYIRKWYDAVISVGLQPD